MKQAACAQASGSAKSQPCALAALQHRAYGALGGRPAAHPHRGRVRRHEPLHLLEHLVPAQARRRARLRTAALVRRSPCASRGDSSAASPLLACARNVR